MKITRPNYYDTFVCLASDCPFTCCQSWTIAVDAETREHWKKLPVPEGMLGREAERESGAALQWKDAPGSDAVLCKDAVSGRNTANCSDAAFRQDAVTRSGAVLADFLAYDSDGSTHIALGERGTCPFLDDAGLCRIVSAYGEESISTTCHTYPRERHVFADLVEDTLNMGCPQALRLLWNSGVFGVKIVDENGSVGASGSGGEAGSKGAIGSSDVPDSMGTSDSACGAGFWNRSASVSVVLSVEDGSSEAADEVMLGLRARMIDFLADPSRNLFAAWKMLFYIMLEVGEDMTEERVHALFGESFLAELAAAVEEAEADPYAAFNEQNELFLDLADNYRKKGIYADVLEPLARLAEEYEAGTEESEEEDAEEGESICEYADEDTYASEDGYADASEDGYADASEDGYADASEDDPVCGMDNPGMDVLMSLEEFEETWSIWESQVRILMQEEVYSCLYLPGGDAYSMTLKMEWMGIFLVVLRHCLFLRWKEKGSLDREDVEQIVCVLIRMTGYSEADIEEYLEESFEDVIWEW